MGKIDPEQERERLAARYADMSDLELEKVGRDPDALTEWAHAAFQDEMEKRGLKWDPVRRAARPISEDETLIAVGTFPTRNEAAMAVIFSRKRELRFTFSRLGFNRTKVPENLFHRK